MTPSVSNVPAAASSLTAPMSSNDFENDVEVDLSAEHQDGAAGQSTLQAAGQPALETAPVPDEVTSGTGAVGVDRDAYPPVLKKKKSPPPSYERFVIKALKTLCEGARHGFFIEEILAAMMTYAVKARVELPSEETLVPMVQRFLKSATKLPAATKKKKGQKGEDAPVPTIRKRVHRTTKRAPHAYRATAPYNRSTKKKKERTGEVQLYFMQTKNEPPQRYLVSACSKREALQKPPVAGTKVTSIYHPDDSKRAREYGLTTTRVVNEFGLPLNKEAKTALALWELYGGEIVDVPDDVHLLV